MNVTKHMFTEGDEKGKKKACNQEASPQGVGGKRLFGLVSSSEHTNTNTNIIV